MFSFITKTWNPLGGQCKHGCVYCWVEQLKTRYPLIAKKYGCSEPFVDPKILSQATKFTVKDIVFVCSCNDLFGEWVPKPLIYLILNAIADSKAQFLLLTKKPYRYLYYIERSLIPKNVILGATITTDLGNEYQLSNFRNVRYYSSDIHKCMLSIEPIEKFSIHFLRAIKSINPDFVAVGYNSNKSVKLDEPSLKDTLELIGQLEQAGITVYRKLLREAVTV